MTLSPDIIFAGALAYAALLFGIAFYADRRAQQGRMRWLSSPLVYTLSLSVYCTSWTFYGAVGTAARSGLEFLPIYLGPTLVFVGWWVFMRRVVRLGRAQNTTSIADFLSSRYGKSPWLAAAVTVIAVVAVVPYIALQLRAVAASYQILAAGPGFETGTPPLAGPVYQEGVIRAAFWLAAGLALFTILFGTRNLDANERHQGVVAAIALEAVVKLTAVIAVGVFAIWGVAGGLGAVLDQAPPSLAVGADLFDTRWAALTFLSAAAVICLPRQFQVTVVECVDPDHGRTASWAFPLYLLLISVFVAPIAIVGGLTVGAGGDPDLYVLTLPLSQGQNALALLVFLGGFSTATSMVIVSCIALSTMISNHLALPLAMPRHGDAGVTGDVRNFLINARRAAIVVILALGFLYLVWSGQSAALASIGLISFAGVAQFLPPLAAGLFWRRATSAGALCGLGAGFLVWLVCLFTPSLSAPGDGALRASIIAMTGDDPLMFTLFWSLAANITCLVGVSLLWGAKPFEKLQGALFLSSADDDLTLEGAAPFIERTATSRDLYILAQRILGGEAAHQLFENYRRRQGLKIGLPAADAALIADLERRLAAGIGAASAHAMVSQIATGERLSLDGLLKIADENARLLHYSARLEHQSVALRESARRLSEANARLTQLDAQKDDFLAQISHELRTPMTSMRAFSELLLRPDGLDDAKIQRFAGIIHEESRRLTRLLDQILDFGRIERGELALARTQIDPEIVIDRAVAAISPLADENGVVLRRVRSNRPGGRVSADPDRIQQVLMNVLTNSIKFNDQPDPTIWIDAAWRLEAGQTGGGASARFVIAVADNGPGVPETDRSRIFEKFARGGGEGPRAQRGVGLGLAISREIMALHGGAIDLGAPSRGGATFVVTLPDASTPGAEAAGERQDVPKETAPEL